MVHATFNCKSFSGLGNCFRFGNISLHAGTHAAVTDKLLDADSEGVSVL